MAQENPDESDIYRATQSDSVTEKIALLEKMGASMSTQILRDTDGKVLSVVVIVVGQPEAQEMVDAANALEVKWHS